MFRFRDPRSGIRKKPIPDPGSGVKKAQDPVSGSATLHGTALIGLSWNRNRMGNARKLTRTHKPDFQPMADPH